jgi:lipoate-protein ligase B
MDPQTDPVPGPPTPATLRVRRLGGRSCRDAWALQERAAAAVAAGGVDQLLFVSHPPVVTLGRGTTPDQLLAPPTELAAAGIGVLTTDRGGGATYHGPGQIVGYPLIDLRRRSLTVRSYLRAMEAALVAVLRGEGIAAFTRPGLTGVWTAAGKIAAIGISVRGGVTRHGFALNVDTDLGGFARILPCGLADPVTSMRESGWSGSIAALTAGLAAALEKALLGASGAPWPEGKLSGSEPRPPCSRRHGRGGATLAGISHRRLGATNSDEKYGPAAPPATREARP